MGNTIITLLSLLKVKQEFISLMCAELDSISPHNKLKAISFETMPCNPNERL